jgi:hypothetical protein
MSSLSGLLRSENGLPLDIEWPLMMLTFAESALLPLGQEEIFQRKKMI